MIMILLRVVGTRVVLKMSIRKFVHYDQGIALEIALQVIPSKDNFE